MVANVSVAAALMESRSVRVNMLVFFVAIVSSHGVVGGCLLRRCARAGSPDQTKTDAPWYLIQHLIFSMGDTPSQLVPTHPSLYRNKPLDIGVSHILSRICIY